MTTNLDLAAHWDEVYRTKAPDNVSWYQEYPASSMRLMEYTQLEMNQRIIDVGCGAHGITQALLEAGYEDVVALDISVEAVRAANHILGEQAAEVTWIVGSVLDAALPQVDVWHDRAVFHFLTREEDRQKYRRQMLKAIASNGSAIIAGFACGGADKCSGLDVYQLCQDRIIELFGQDFELVMENLETHITPWGTEQPFSYYLLKRK